MAYDDDQMDGPIGSTDPMVAQRANSMESTWGEQPGNPGRAWQDPRTDPTRYFNPGNGQTGQYIQNMYGASQGQMDASAQRRTMLEALAANAQGVASNPQMQDAYQQAALGQGPSAAQMQLNNAMGQALGNQMALASSAHGSQNARNAAMYQAQQNMANLGSNYGAQAATLRAQEMQQARAQYLQNQELQARQAMGYYGMSQEQLEREYARRMAMGQNVFQAGEGVRQFNTNADNQRLATWMGPISGLIRGGVSGAASGIMQGAMGSGPAAAEPESGTWA